MSNHYTVDILTPSKVIAKNLPAESLLIPTEGGQINVLENHTHIVTKLATGELTVFGGSGDADRFFTITAGVCKVLDDKVVILSQVSEENKDIDVERAKRSLKNAEEKLNNESLSDDERTKYQRKTERSQLRIQLGSAK
jgi:F-type H+-transporting ATPase subunit epsilon